MFSKYNPIRAGVCGAIVSGILASTVALAAQKPKPQAKVQTVAVSVDNGFKPSTITVHAGQPVKIVFNPVHTGCVNSVVFKSLGLSKPVSMGHQTVITFTPKKAGTIAFACGMGMMKGKVVVK